MKNLFYKCIFFACTIIVFASCATIDNNHRTIGDVIAHFDNSGLKAEKIYPSLADMIKADSGCVLVFEGQRFEIYKYNINKSEQKAKLDMIKENNEMVILGFKNKVLVNGSFILLNYRGHIKEAEIVEAFKSFK